MVDKGNLFDLRLGESCQVLIRKACLWIILDNMFVEHQALISVKDISYGSYKKKVLVD